MEGMVCKFNELQESTDNAYGRAAPMGKYLP